MCLVGELNFLSRSFFLSLAREASGPSSNLGLLPWDQRLGRVQGQVGCEGIGQELCALLECFYSPCMKTLAGGESSSPCLSRGLQLTQAVLVGDSGWVWVFGLDRIYIS